MHNNIIKIIVLIFLAGSFGGCLQSAGYREVDELDRLYEVYLNGDIEDAKVSMNEAINLLTLSESIHGKGRAHGLVMAYGRLTCIALSENDQDAARSNFEKAKTYRSEKLKFQSMPNDDIQPLSEDEYQKRLDEFAMESFTEQLSKMDLAHTEGSGPKYKNFPNQANEPTSVNASDPVDTQSEAALF